MKKIDLGPDASHLSPFERFESFARKIVTVPKKELDAKLAEYKRQKIRKLKRKAS